MTTRIAILDDYFNKALESAPWDSLSGCETTAFDTYIEGEDNVVAAMQGFDVICCMRERTRFPASVLERLPDLKLMQTTGMRNPSIDMEFTRARGIDVCGAVTLGFPPAEHTIALMMALAKRITWEDRTMKSGGWQHGFTEFLGGKTLGIVGLGRLGKFVARVALAMEMNVIAWGRSLTDETAAAEGVTRVELDQLYRDSDYISLLVVLSDETRGMVGARELGLMKPTAHLINTSRGPVCDEDALVDTLQRGAIAGAAIDVFGVEPLPKDHPFRKLDNVILSGHMGYVVQEAWIKGYTGMVNNIQAWLDGKPTNVINP